MSVHKPRGTFAVALPMVDPGHYVTLAQRAEAAGYRAVAVPESVFYPKEVSARYPYSDDGKRFWAPETPFIDPFIAIATMAAHTTSLMFMTNVVKLAIREPLLCAKSASSLAVMSENRFELGVGLSWIPEEFTFLNQDMKTRGKRTNEAIEIIRSVTSGDFVAFHGEYYEFEELMMKPGPTEPIKIFVGGHSRGGLHRAATLGDGWISTVISTTELTNTIASLHKLRTEAQIDRPFEVKAIANDVFDRESSTRLFEAGATEVMVCPWYFYGGDSSALDDQIAGIERFAEEVIHAS